MISKTTLKILIGLLCLLNSFIITAQEKPNIKIGGALRFNYNLSSWKNEQITRGGDFGFDVFRLNIKAKYNNLKLNAEYRFYSKEFGGGMLKQGWVEYDFKKNNNIQIGLIQVPFGITPYNSHNWFFNINYYVGLEDDHDMGIKYTYKSKKIDYSIAFFKNAEELIFGNNSDLSNSRYSYDVSSIELNDKKKYRNKEVNQLNVSLNYKLGDIVKHNIGVSGEFGGLYNLDTKEIGNHYAGAIFYSLKFGKFDAKVQISNYNYNPSSPKGERKDAIAMTAYGAPYLIASKASTYTMGVAYSIPTKWNILTNIQIYNDFGILKKDKKEFNNSIMNVLGMLITAGNIYTYIDYALGKNQPWLGSNWTNALEAGKNDSEWHSRFNINIGYYF